jgi:hypothetical protein
VQEQQWRQVAGINIVALNDLCDCVAGVANVPHVEVWGNLSAFFSLLLLLLLVLLLPLLLFERLELLEMGGLLATAVARPLGPLSGRRQKLPCDDFKT